MTFEKSFGISFNKHRKTLKQIQDIADELERILDEDTDEKVMSFTEDKEIRHLLEQINRTGKTGSRRYGTDYVQNKLK